MSPNAQASAGGRQCFNAEAVNGFEVVDRRTVDLIVGAGRSFRVNLLGICPQVEDALSVGVRTRTGSGLVCENDDVDLIVPGQTGARSCPVVAIRARTAAEIEADRRSR